MARKRKRKVVEGIQVRAIADRGKAIGKDAEGKVYFVDGAVPGDEVSMLVLKKKKSFFVGKVQEITKHSEDRVEPKCQHFGVCGGCKWQHYDYQKQLEQKSQIVKDAMRRIGKIDESVVKPIIGAEENYYYRNKIEYSFSSKRWLTEEEIQSDVVFDNHPALGFHRPGAFDKIVDVYECHLQDQTSDRIRNFIRNYALEHQLSYFNIKENKGLLRNIILRNTVDGKWMITLCFGARDDEQIQKLCDALLDQFSEIETLYYVVNLKKNDTILDQKMELVHGPGYLIESLGDVQYKIGPKSFFQTNTKQAYRLYSEAVNLAQLKPTDKVFDLYCGIGSIGLFVAKSCASVVGIELVKEAIEDAKENVALNKTENCEFYAGDVKDIMNEAFINQYGTPDVIITDPPRAGMHKDVVQSLLDIACPKLVYISCNPATQARDLELLKEKYEVTVCQPVDMFPHTSHIENIAVLEIKS